MNDHDNKINGSPPAGTEQDHVELALAGRLTVLERWREGAEEAIGLLALAVIAAALAGLTTLIMLKRKGLIG